MRSVLLTTVTVLEGMAFSSFLAAWEKKVKDQMRALLLCSPENANNVVSNFNGGGSCFYHCVSANDYCILMDILDS